MPASRLSQDFASGRSNGLHTPGHVWRRAVSRHGALGFRPDGFDDSGSPGCKVTAFGFAPAHRFDVASPQGLQDLGRIAFDRPWRSERLDCVPVVGPRIQVSTTIRQRFGWIKKDSSSPAQMTFVESESEFQKARRRSWARLIARTWHEDQSLSTGCGTEMKILSAITAPAQDDVIEKIWRSGVNGIPLGWKPATLASPRSAKITRRRLKPDRLPRRPRTTTRGTLGSERNDRRSA